MINAFILFNFILTMTNEFILPAIIKHFDNRNTTNLTLGYTNIMTI
jgi:hypothetical protein